MRIILLCACLTIASAAALAESELFNSNRFGETNKPQIDPTYYLLADETSSSNLFEQLAVDYSLSLLSAPIELRSLGESAVIFKFRQSAHNHKKQLEALRGDRRTDGVALVSSFVVSGAASQIGRKSVEQNLGDPYYPLQHSHLATRVTESQRYARGKGVKIAVIDTGIDEHHIDLRNQLDQYLNFVSAEQDINSMEFHATAVAGVIAAEGGNGHGIVGVAPDARLSVLRACVEANPGNSRGKCSSLALARALDWAIINQVQIINMSVRGQDDDLVTRLIRKAYDKGIVVVAATDLTHGELDFPAKLNEVIAVSDQESNSLVGLAAHSQRIFIAPGEEILSTLPNNTYDFVTGASFAAAHVSGIIALILEAAPDYPPAEVITLLRGSVRVVNWSIIVDSCQALAQLGTLRSCDPYW